jgi:FADH2 O2-dependent halogenase
MERPPAAGQDSAGPEFDVVLLGGHLVTGLLATVLARAGQRVALVVDPSAPTPTGGETTVPYTAEMFALLGARFGLEEISALGRFDTVPAQLRGAGSAKRCLSFAQHTAGGTASEDLQFVVPSEHSEWQLNRTALDGWSVDLARRHGATVVTGQPLATPVRRGAGWRVPLGRTSVTGSFLIDSTGRHDSGWSGALGVTWQPDRGGLAVMRGHVPASIGAGGPSVPAALPWAEGTTLHGTADGVVELAAIGGAPAGTRLTSVSLALRPGAAPEAPGLALRRLAHRYPSLAPHLSGLGAAGSWCETAVTGHCVPPVDAPLLLLERSAHTAPFALSRDITCGLELVYAVGVAFVGAFRTGQPVEVARLAALQRDLLAAHTRWADAAVRCAGDWPRWNALLRLWLLWTIMSSLSVKSARLRAAAPGGWSALDARLADRHWYQPPRSLVSVVDDGLCLLTSEDAELAPEEAASAVLTRLGCERVVPPLFDFADPEARSYRFTMARRLRMLVWAKFSARREFADLLTTDNVTGLARR